MSSAIDPTKPQFGNPTTADVRANFAAAKSEIEALQAAQQTSGTWTPELTFNDDNTGMVITSRYGYWTRIGQILMLAWRIQLSSKGTATGLAFVRGAPYISDYTTYATDNQYFVLNNPGGTPPDWPFADVQADAGVIRLQGRTAGVSSFLTEANISDTTIIRGANQVWLIS